MALALGRKPLFKKHQGSEEMTLQITSMADIFTIILVFLLKSYSTSALAVTPAPGTMLPVAHGNDAPAEALKIEITDKSVQVEGKPVATLEGYRFKGDTGKELGAVLSHEREKQLLIAKANPDVKVDAKVLVIADQRVPYSTVKTVLTAAASQGYTDFKLAVVQGE
ncbi:MAG: ExbD/TolR family protein [Bdellovibrionota bacterium]